LTTEIRIRKAKESEFGSIQRMSLGQLRNELSEYERPLAEEAEKVFAERLGSLLGREGNEIYVAEDGNRMIGYVWFGISERPFSAMRTGWIYDIQVLPSYRGSGIGKALMKHALELSKARGFQVTGLMVNAKNKVAFSLYEKLGFQAEYMLMSRQETSPIHIED
jgi:ribosomal protein S18 acetylase RimI-like enzyme